VNLLLLLLTSVFAGFLPMVCWAVLVWWFDRYEKEPVRLLLISGIAELILALFSGYKGDVASTGLTILNLGVMAPAVEEGMKFLGLLGVFWIAQREIDGPLDGIIYGAMVGFGFAATENFLYFLTSQTMAELLLLIFLRAMLFGTMHAMFTSFSGLGLAFAKYARPGWKAPMWAAGGYFVAVLFHGLFNTSISLAADTPYTLLGLLGCLFVFGIGVSIILMLSVGSLIRERRTIRKYLQPYVEQGIVKPNQWAAAVSMRSRLYAEWEALGRFDFGKYRRIGRLHTICAELAFKEKQQQLWGKDPKVDQQIAKLSLEMQTLSEAFSQSKA
jgi:RsiW-degrading membrane proteinase PrsW (M82 family)